MSRYYSYLNSAENILTHFRGEMPLSVYLKSFFAANKKIGSRDRKTISSLCYQYFRLGSYGKNLPVRKRLELAITVFPVENAAWLEALDLQPATEALVEEIISQLFPFLHLLPSSFDTEAFARSFLVQPSVFIRIRPGHSPKVERALQQHSKPYQVVHKNCLKLPGQVNIDSVLSLNKEAVVQDYSSQMTGQILAQHLTGHLFEGESLGLLRCKWRQKHYAA